MELIMPAINNNRTIHLIYGGIIGIIVCLFFVTVYYTGSPGSIKIQLNENQLVEIKLAGKGEKNLSIDRILDELLRKDERRKIATLAFLKERGLYEVTDVKIVEPIGMLKFNHPVSQDLRELLENFQGPFKYPEKEVKLSLPGNIKQGKGASCRDNQFFRKHIKIFNKDRTKSIDSVHVSGSIPCGDSDEDMKELIQLSHDDIKSIIDSPLDRIEEGWAQQIVSP